MSDYLDEKIVHHRGDAAKAKHTLIYLAPFAVIGATLYILALYGVVSIDPIAMLLLIVAGVWLVIGAGWLIVDVLESRSYIKLFQDLKDTRDSRTPSPRRH